MTLEFSAVLALIALLSGAWWRIETRINRAERDADDAIREAKTEAAARAIAADAKANLALDRLREHEKEVAEKYVSKAGFRENMDQMLREMQTGFKHLHDKIDLLVPPATRRRMTREE